MVTMGTMGMEFPQLQQIHSSFSHTWWISSDVRTPSVFTSANCLSESYKNEILPRNREQINFMKNWHSGHQFQHLSYTQYNKFVLNFLNLVSVGIRKTIIQYSKYLDSTWTDLMWKFIRQNTGFVTPITKVWKFQDLTTAQFIKFFLKNWYI